MPYATAPSVGTPVDRSRASSARPATLTRDDARPQGRPQFGSYNAVLVFCAFRNHHYTLMNAHDGSAMPGRVADPSARVWPRKCGIVTFDVIEIDCPKRRLRLLQGRASLNLDKIIFEIITARK